MFGTDLRVQKNEKNVVSKFKITSDGMKLCKTFSSFEGLA